MLAHRFTRLAAVTIALGVGAVGAVIGVDALPAALRPHLAAASVLVVQPDAQPSGSTVVDVVGDDDVRRPASVVVVIPDDATPTLVDPATVASLSTGRSTSTSSAEVTAPPDPPPSGEPRATWPPPGEYDVDGDVWVDDPDGQLADVQAAAASASASAAAAGHDARTDSRAGTAIDDDNDVAAAAQGYAGAIAGNDAAAVAVAVAAAADNNVAVGEPEVEAEAEIELPDDAVGWIEIYADVGVIVLSDDVRGYDDGTSLVIETALVIVRNGQVVIVTADGTTGRINGSSSTTGTVVGYERTYTIDEDESILGDSGQLPDAVARRLLAELAASDTPEPPPERTSGSSWESIGAVLDDFVDEMVSAVTSEPDVPVSFDDVEDGDGDATNSTPPGGVTPGVESDDRSAAEAEAEAEAEADASQSGAASAAAAASSSAAATDAEADAAATADGAAQADAGSESESSAATESEAAGGGQDDTSEPETSTSDAVSTEAEASNGDDTVTQASDDDSIDLDEPLEDADDDVVATP